MAEDSELEKTESASERRLEQAREEGNIPRSKEMGSILLLFTMATLLYNSRDTLGRSLFDVLRMGLAFDARNFQRPENMFERMTELGSPIAYLWLPTLFFVALVVALWSVAGSLNPMLSSQNLINSILLQDSPAYFLHIV
jgi:flagellar biosynthesis protein FlhB